MKLPSVTTVLQPWSDFSMVRPEVLERAAQNGELVHSLLARHLLGLEVFPEEITPEVAGSFASGRRWADKFVKAVHLVEKELEDKIHGYQGHPDLICTMKGDQGQSLWDWKNGVFMVAHAVQLGGYYGLALNAGFEIKRAGCIYLNKAGKMPKVHETTGILAQDLAVFRCALTCFRRFNP